MKLVTEPFRNYFYNAIAPFVNEQPGSSLTKKFHRKAYTQCNCYNAILERVMSHSCHSIKPHKCVQVNIIKSILKINKHFVVLRVNMHWFPWFWSGACTENGTGFTVGLPSLLFDSQCQRTGEKQLINIRLIGIVRQHRYAKYKMRSTAIDVAWSVCMSVSVCWTHA